MRLAPLVLALVCGLVLFTGLGRIGLMDQREARDAEVGRELVKEREPLTPLFGHEPLFDKPVLAYAPEAAAQLGPKPRDVWSRRLRALVAILLVALTASVGAEHFGARAGWFAALVLASSLGLPLCSRTDGTQLLASVLGWVGAAALADALFGRRAGRELRLVVGYGALAAAFAATGPLPALWPLGGLALYLALARDASGWKRARPLAGLLIMAGLGLPWYAAMFERHGLPFLAHAPFFPYGAGERGPWYSGPVFMLSFLVVDFFPWSALLPGAMLHAATWWRATRGPVARAETRPAPEKNDPMARERHEEGAAHFFIACLLAALVPIAIYPAAPMPAALPALPAAALLCGRFLDHLFEDAARVARPFGRAALMLGLFGGVGAVALAVLSPYVRGATQDLRLLAATLLVASWAPFLANFLGRRRLAATLMLLPVAIGTPIVTLRLLPAMEGYLNARQVAAAMNAVSPRLAPLVLLEPPPPSLRLYGRHNLVVEPPPLRAALERYRAIDRQTYVAFRPGRESEVARHAGAPLEILIRTPSMILARVHGE